MDFPTALFGDIVKYIFFFLFSDDENTEYS